VPSAIEGVDRESGRIILVIYNYMNSEAAVDRFVQTVEIVMDGASFTIALATQTELVDVLKLLESVDLCTDGVEECLGTILVARVGKTVVGSTALEFYGRSALLRSVAVAPRLRGKRIGGELVKGALELARRYGVANVYLLTDTASGYFPRYGFREIERSKVPAVVRTSIEFTQICPDTATVMWTSIAGDGGK
jgi:N-acetylglutamate synthase-like GNAT family acetyltransferase